jgi:hypothetical protein
MNVMEILEFVFSGFWVWAGTMFAFGALLQFVAKCWNRFLRHLNIRKHGWPPSHLDADGDWKPEPKNDE